MGLTGFVDTGNQLYDPYQGRPVQIVWEESLKGFLPFKNNIWLERCQFRIIIASADIAGVFLLFLGYFIGSGGYKSLIFAGDAMRQRF